MDDNNFSAGRKKQNFLVAEEANWGYIEELYKKYIWIRLYVKIGSVSECVHYGIKIDSRNTYCYILFNKYFT